MPASALALVWENRTNLLPADSQVDSFPKKNLPRTIAARSVSQEANSACLLSSDSAVDQAAIFTWAIFQA